MTPAVTYVEALQTTLVAEHGCVFVLGYLGAQTSQSAQPVLADALRSAFEVHRARRDELSARLRAAGEVPAAAASSYELTDVAGDPRRITDQALGLERSLGRAYGFLVAASPADQRRWAIDALLDSARRELGFGGSPRRYPGR